MKKLLNKTTYSIVAIVIASAAITCAFAAGMNIPLNEAGYVIPSSSNGLGSDGLDVRGQTKTGQLTVGSSTLGTSSLTEVGSAGLQVSHVACTSGVPCPYTIGANTDLHVLQAGYIDSLVVGAPINTPITTGASLDVHGQIEADPASPYLNWPAGAFYSTGSGSSTALKPICATPLGDLVVCGTDTDGTCGTAQGTSLSSINPSTPGLCASGTPSIGIQTYSSTFSWSCVGLGGGATASCSATNAGYSAPGGGGIPSGGSGTQTGGGGVQIPSGQ